MPREYHCRSLLLANSTLAICIVAIDVFLFEMKCFLALCVQCAALHFIHGTACVLHVDKNLIAGFAYCRRCFFIPWVLMACFCLQLFLYVAIMAVHGVEISADIYCVKLDGIAYPSQL